MKCKVLLVFLWLLGFLQSVEAKSQLGADSVYTLNHVRKVHLTYPDSALHLLDVILQTQQEPECHVLSYRGLVYSAQRKYRLALSFSERALADTALQADPVLYLQTLTYAAEASMQAGKGRELLPLLFKGIDFARQQKRLTAESNFLFMAGQIYYQTGEKKEAYAYFDKALQNGKTSEKVRYSPYFSYFYGELSQYLTDDGRYDEALAVCQLREDLLQHLSQLPRIPLGYLDEQYAYLYIKRAILLAKMGRKSDARKMYQQFVQTSAATRPDFQDYHVLYDLEMHHYQGMIARLTPLMATADTIQQRYADRLGWLSQAYRGIGKDGTACTLLERREVIQDSLFSRKQHAEMEEIATLFHSREQDLLISRQERQLHHNRVVHLFLSLGLVLLGLLLWLSLYHTRLVKRKNILLVEKINSLYLLRKQKESLEQGLMEQAAPAGATKTRDAAPVVEGGEGQAPPVGVDDQPAVAADLSHLQEQALFKRLDRIVREEQLYLNPNFTRQDLSDRFSLDKTLFSRLLQEYAQMSLPQYIADLRIRHAVFLMQQQPNYTLQAIAEASGFANSRQFQRSFKAINGMTPSEYRSAMLAQEENSR